MKYTPRVKNNRDELSLLYDSLEPAAKGFGVVILELSLFRSKGRGKGGQAGVQIRVTVYKDGNIGIDDCSGFHRAILPRLELAFPEKDIYLEVLSPGIGRLIKDGSEFIHFIGRGIKCYTGQSDLKISQGPFSGWINGILRTADENGISLETADGIIKLSFQEIAKAKLDESLDLKE